MFKLRNGRPSSVPRPPTTKNAVPSSPGFGWPGSLSPVWDGTQPYEPRRVTPSGIASAPLNQVTEATTPPTDCHRNIVPGNVESSAKNRRFAAQRPALHPASMAGAGKPRPARAPGIGLTGSTDDNRPGIELAVNGLWRFDNNFLLDGVDNNGIGDGTIAVNPSPDAIGRIPRGREFHEGGVGRGARR